MGNFSTATGAVTLLMMLAGIKLYRVNSNKLKIKAL
jgi:hypothetical protein